MNLKVLNAGRFNNANVTRFEEIVKNFPNLEQISFDLNGDHKMTADEAKTFAIQAIKILAGGLGRLKLLACTEICFVYQMKVSFSLDDIKFILEDAENIEFFMINGEISDFDEIYKNFRRKFDTVRYSEGHLLISQWKVLHDVKNDKEGRLKGNFNKILDLLNAKF